MNDLTPLDIFDPSSYPTRRDEEWHYSDLSRVLREAPEYSAVPGRALPAKDGELTIFNGGYSDLESATVEGRLHLQHTSFAQGDDAIGHQSTASFNLAEGESLLLFETYNGFEIWHDGVLAEKDNRPYVANTTLRFKLAEGASVIRVVILEEPETAVSIRRSTVETAPNSVFKQYVFSTGAKFQRFETLVDHVGQGAEVELNGAYLLKDKTHFDYTTRITHSGRDGVTRQLIKGLVKDQATGVFQGRILVERGADGTDARMHHQALMLNDGAHVRAKPELEIYADDVQCAHGNTIGALDEAALFFCQSRGMPEAVARAMLTQAFVIPVAEMIEDEALRDKVLTFLTEKAEVFHGL